MSSWMKSLNDGAKKVGDEAHKLKVKAEIAMLETKITTYKEEWGKKCFDKYAVGDMNAVNGEHLRLRKQIEITMEKISAKKRELETTTGAAPVVVNSVPARLPRRRAAPWRRRRAEPLLVVGRDARRPDHERHRTAERGARPADRRRPAQWPEPPGRRAAGPRARERVPDPDLAD